MGKVGSSTMPHKRNPWYVKIYWSYRAGQWGVALSFGAMIQEHEGYVSFGRQNGVISTDMYYVGFERLALKIILENMIVHEDSDPKEFHMTKGLIVSERAMLNLGHYLGGRMHMMSFTTAP